jgi:hypothetical protein
MDPTGSTHPPLSQCLADLLKTDSAAEGISLNRLLEQTGGRGLYLVIIILCLPFVVPVSLPGLSTVMGSIIVLLVLSLSLGRQARLPDFLGKRRLPPAVQRRAVGGSIRFLRLLEHVIRPRRSRWLALRLVRGMNLFLIAFMALLLALPLPSPPFFFTNTLPSYAIIVLAAGMMEEDGWIIWLGYALALANLVFFALIAGAIATFAARAWVALARHFGSP